MSQVKNLRAMFENKGDTSPPDRGRSTGSHESESPRPLSKVRTSFVAIEKDGRMGLQRDHSGESSVSRRRLSNETDAESTSTFPDKSSININDDSSRAARRLFVHEPIPESPRDPPDMTNSTGPPVDTGNIRAQEPVGDKPAETDLSTEEPKPSPADGITNGNSPPVAATEPVHTAKASKEKPATKTSARTTTSTTKPTSQPVAKLTATATAPARAIKTQNPKPLTKASDKANVKKTPSATSSKSTATTAAATAKTTNTTAGKKPAPLNTSTTSDTGFVKPKPKSPTKPVHLPSSLTAPTASYVSKVNAPGQMLPRQSVSRQSGNLQPPGANSRSPSRASDSVKTLRRQASTISHPRPSIGPPPKKVSQAEKPASKAPVQVDEGFLARMMRPTQASSSKTSEKAPVTPPRKTVRRPATASSSHRDGSGLKGTHANTGSPSRTPPKASSKPSPSIAVKVEAPETLASEPSDSLRAQEPLKATAGEDSAQTDVSNELVAEVAQMETAEQAIELANEAGLQDSLEESKNDPKEQNSEVPAIESPSLDNTVEEPASEPTIEAKEPSEDAVETLEPEGQPSDTTQEAEKSKLDDAPEENGIVPTEESEVEMAESTEETQKAASAEKTQDVVISDEVEKPESPEPAAKVAEDKIE
ncbi:hypothetical protein S40285_04334 [Stachybotrys chlorohalonatus IBT 40285]|uniref:Uncharacterized protein n=1 Tax=Stachybotrys chlorohalonatus (strain IBT 40285) TaxID=1283841 RepID=A0A084QNS4_STAC4|nr:hypothetical protein S40285_04334 [Stachybotrys chlorohalonata IBT 40285]